MLNDAENKPMRGWDSRGNRLRHQYDALKRPQYLYVQTDGGPERTAESILYGEGQANDQALNLRGKAFKQFDGAGVVTNSQYDFKGNLVAGRRQLLSNYADDVDWSANPVLVRRLTQSRFPSMH